MNFYWGISNFNSFIYDQYKIGLIFTLLFRTFSMISDFPRFHTEVSHLTDILRKNTFLIKLVDNCIKSFFNKMFLHTPVALTVEKKQLFIALPYLLSFIPYNKNTFTKKYQQKSPFL